ncbi:MAG: deoxynucleoside kinase [Deltaproteobacteria bacterium]|nr:deoxynucleoside kinase [Deltaproteobacteria bacterium]
MGSSYLAIAGNMGAGKSSLVDFLWKAYGCKPFFEPQDINPYLTDFYRDMRSWAFHSQMFFLTKKFRHYLDLQARRPRRPMVLDRTIYEDAEIFAANLHRMRLIPRREFAVYWDLYQTILDVLEPPRVLIYLTCSLRTMRKRIGRRGRQAEGPIQTGYLKKLQCLYDRWIERYDRSPVISLATDHADYLDDFLVREELEKKLRSYL